MNIIENLDVFREVARTLSFSKAAHALHMSNSSVTKKVRSLETEFGAKLFIRNTKSVQLTESGQILLSRIDTIPKAFADLRTAINETTEGIQGKLKISTPPSFGNSYLTKAIRKFLMVYPDLNIELTLDDGTLNIITENIDLAIRIGTRLKDSSHIAYKVAEIQQMAVAAPSYLKRRATPLTPQDLLAHNCLIHTIKSHTQQWSFKSDKGENYPVKVKGDFSSDFGDLILSMTLQGHGISIHPLYMIESHLIEGRLLSVMSQFKCENVSIYALTQSKDFQPLKVSLFIQFLKKSFLKSNSNPESTL